LFPSQKESKLRGRRASGPDKFEAGTLTDTYHQDAYGNILSNVNTGAWASASSFSGRHLTTKEYDNQAYLYYFWQRWYDPRVGRFISPNLLRIDIEHPYQYAGNGATNNIDPAGLLAIVPPIIPVVSPLCLAQVGYALHKMKKLVDQDHTMDKYAHCYVGCKISAYCGYLACLPAGTIKEAVIDDILGRGHPDPDDCAATELGCDAGMNPFKTCECSCKKKISERGWNVPE